MNAKGVTAQRQWNIGNNRAYLVCDSCGKQIIRVASKRLGHHDFCDRACFQTYRKTNALAKV